jgi:hypothetical protein
LFHSADYISTQARGPKFKQEFKQAEVTKMIKAYGTPIDDAEVPQNRRLSRRDLLKFDANCGPRACHRSDGNAEHRPFDKIENIGIFRSSPRQMDRETGKMRKCAAIMIVFGRNPDVV